MKRIGINTESITFGENADFGTGSRLFTEEELDRLQESINEAYTIFKNKIIDGRIDIWNSEGDSLKIENIDLNQIAMGRVFTGDTASKFDLSLVDKLGGFHDAIETAKNAAGINGDIEIIEYPKKNNDMSFEFELGVKDAVKEKFIQSLPEEIAKQYEFIELMKILSSDEKQVILPYKIEVK